MPHKDWCGNPCSECARPCALDESIPCSPDCDNLNPDGTRAVLKCNASRCDAILPERIEVDTVFGKLYAEASGDPKCPAIRIGLAREDADRTTNVTLALAECTPDLPVKGGHALRLLVWKVFFDECHEEYTFAERRTDADEDYRYEVYGKDDKLLDGGDGFVCLDSAIEFALDNGGDTIKQMWFPLDENGELNADDCSLIGSETVWLMPDCDSCAYNGACIDPDKRTVNGVELCDNYKRKE